MRLQTKKQTPLHFGAMNGSAAAISVLLQNGSTNVEAWDDVSSEANE
jgi:hypothetical protein